MMLRLVSKAPACLGVSLLLAWAGCAWAQQSPAATDPAPQPTGQSTTVERAAGEDSEAVAAASATAEEPSPAELFASLPRFGEGVFALPEAKEVEKQPAPGETAAPGTVSSAGAPPANLPVPPNYIIGPGDRLSLRVWSNDWEQVRETVTVSPEGLIVLEDTGPMAAAGQTLEELREALLQVYRRLYVEPTVTLVVAEQRVVEVYVTGDAVRPGKYTLPGMATVFSALYACGGPSAVGSYRRIQLNRPGEPPIIIDLYDYLLEGRREHDEVLRPGDVLFIPTLGDEIGVAGEVRRPARYELKEPLSVQQALAMAGGLNPAAYVPALYLWRAGEGRRWKLITVNSSDPNSPDLAQPLRSGDLLTVKQMLPWPGNTVQLKGAVKRPGYYPVLPGARISDLIAEAEGVSSNAHLGRGTLLRRNEDLHYEMTTFNVAEVLAGKPEANLELKPQDIVEIFAQEDVEPEFTVQIDGAVTRPGKYPWAANMRVSQLLFLAGGLVPGAYVQRAELLRLNADQRYETMAVNLRDAAYGEPEADIVLERGDIVHVKLQDEVEPTPQVYIEGYVRKGGAYARPEAMKVSDLIFAAGGLKPGAGPDVELTHGRFEGQAETVHLTLKEGPEGFTVTPDLLLADDDSVCVTGRGDFNVQAELVTIQGRVQRPGSYAIKTEKPGESYTVWDLLQECGGLLEDANPNGMVVYRRRDITIGEAQAEDLNRVLGLLNQETRQPPLQVDATEQAQSMAANVRQGLQQVLSNPSSVSIVLPPRPINPQDRVAAIPVDGAGLMSSRGREGNLELQAGDSVVVPRRVNTVTVLGAVPRPGAVPYLPESTATAYVNDSGGFREDAAPQRMVVVHANGRVTPIKLHEAPQPGDVIIVPARHIVRTVRTESSLAQWLRTIVPLVTARLLF